MKSIIVDGHEAEDIGLQVQKVLRGLGNPEPPLRLADALELLRLDRAYYSSENQGAIREVVSRLMVAGKQILERPTLLIDVIRKAKLSALWLPDRKRILIDESAPKLKHRWNETHEIGHSIIPWHQTFTLGDDEFSLRPESHAQMEAEANFAAGQLLFLQGRFGDEANDVPFGINAVTTLSGRYGNTITSTLWRYVEHAFPSIPVLGVVSGHPHSPDDQFDPNNPCRHFIESPLFRQRFSKVSEKYVFRLIGSYCQLRRGGPLGEADLILADDNGIRHVFHFESFRIGRHGVLTLGRYLRPSRVAVAVP
jgi:hypothetical protein